MGKRLYKPLILIGLLVWPYRVLWAQNIEASADNPRTSEAHASAVAITNEVPKNLGQRPEPGDDFYRFANNWWIAEAQIAASSLSAGALNEARQRTRGDIARLEAELLAGVWPEGSDEHKYQTLYNSFLDERRVNRRGLRPIRDGLRSIRSARSHRDIAILMGNFNLDAGGLFDVSLKVSQQAGRAYIPRLGPAKPLLGLPEAYLRTDAEAVGNREQGVDLLARLLAHGSSRFNRRARAERVLSFETELVRFGPDASAERDPANSQRLFSAAQLEKRAPRFAWRAYLTAHGLGGEAELGLAAFDDLAGLVEVFAQTPVSVLRDYLTLRLMVRFGDYLPEEIARITEQLSQLRSATHRPLPSRADRASAFAQWVLPDVLARNYVKTRLGSQTRTIVETMAEQMRRAYQRRIGRADWLTPQTRSAALAKLEALEFMIGVPPDWNDYSGYEPAAGDLFANAYRKLQSRHLSMLSRQNERQSDGGRDIEQLRRNIFFSPTRVGAYYLPRLNAIILPAAYLQPPFFDPQANAASNFGSLGTTLGHEIGHAFDDQGSQFGPSGAFENWWAGEDRARFNALAQRLSQQFSGHETVPGTRLDTRLTLGENFSDLAGIETALDALLGVTAQSGPPMDEPARQAMLQTFFLSYANKRRRVRRPETDRQFAPSDKHSPPALRTNIILSNIDQWYQAFDIKQTDVLYRPPAERLSIWSSADN